MVLTDRIRVARRQGDRGAILVISALLMIALMVVAAIALDVSNARQVRRLARGSADSAALAGAQDLPDALAVVATVKSLAQQNYGVAASDWIGCVDLDHLNELPDMVANNNQCISIDEAVAQVRVALPTRQVGTTFGRVIGVDNIDVHGVAVAQADLLRDDRIIPATVAAQAGSGNLCIENSGNDIDCASRTSGNFGSFASPRLRLYQPAQNIEPDSLRINYSMGLDHALSIWGSTSTRICDGTIKTPCATSNTIVTQDGNHLLSNTGNQVPPLTDGLVDNATISTTDKGADILFCGRLRRPDLDPSNLGVSDPENCNHWANNPGPGPRIQVIGEYINGRHVTYWMKDEFRSLFYGNGATNSITPNTTPLNDPSWATGDAKLACFMKSYRFDYTGSRGFGPNFEFFIDPAQPIDNVGDGTPFTQTQAINYLVNTCGLNSSKISQKLAAGNDNKKFWPMFDEDMVTDPRFGMIPVVRNWVSGGSTGMPIVRFWGIFMYRLYANNTSVKGVDAWAYETALIETPDGIPAIQFGYKATSPIVHLVR